MDVFFNPQWDGADFKVCAQGYATIHGNCTNGNDPRDRNTLALPFGGHPACICTLDSLGILQSQLPTVVLRSEYPPSIRKFLNAVLDQDTTQLHSRLGTLARDWTSNNYTAKYGKNNRPTPDDDAKFFAQIFKAILRPSPQFLRFLAQQSDTVRSFIPERLFGATPNPLRRHISIHARLGIGLNETEAYPKRFNCTRKRLHLLAACMAGHAAEMADENDLHEPQRFYVATDTPGFLPVLKSELGKRSKNPIVVEGVSEKAHSNTLTTGDERDKRIFLQTMGDIFFLAAGEGIVSLPSGFANLARWFSGKRHRSVSIRQCIREDWEKHPSEFSIVRPQ